VGSGCSLARGFFFSHGGRGSERKPSNLDVISSLARKSESQAAGDYGYVTVLAMLMQWSEHESSHHSPRR
jgi:hypothetical protein